MVLKLCTKCNETYPEDLFPFINKALNKRNTRCKHCVSVYNKALYRKNPTAYKACSNRNMKSRRLELRNKLHEYMQDKSCIDCGEHDAIVLTFDHIHPKDKHYGISRLISNGANWNAILREIAKCEIRCCNCHARRTAVQFGWQKLNTERFTDPYGH